MNRKKRQRLDIQADGDSVIVGLDNIEIWDGADLALLREVLTEMIDKEGYRSVGVNLQSVKYIPSGFFGMLYEWYEDGIHIHLHSPQPNVEQMLWFRMFFSRNLPASLCSTTKRSAATPGQQVEYHKQNFTSGDGEDENGLLEAIRFDIQQVNR